MLRAWGLTVIYIVGLVRNAYGVGERSTGEPVWQPMEEGLVGEGEMIRNHWLTVLLVFVVAVGGCASASSTTTEEAGISTTTTPIVDSTSTTVTSSESTAREAATPVADSDCLASNATMRHAPVAGFESFVNEEMGLFLEEDQAGTRVVRVEWGQVGRAEPGEWIPYSTSSQIPRLRDHARLFFNHRRSLFALAIFLEYGLEQQMTDGPGVDNEVAATWDGETLTYASDESELFPALALLPPPSEGAQPLSQAERIEFWASAESWASDMEQHLVGGIDSLIDLADVDLEEARQRICELLDGEWAISEETASTMTIIEIQENPEIFYREIAVQELLLLNEYLMLMKAVLELPEIDWLDGAGVNQVINAQDGVTSTSEYLGMWQDAGLETIWRFWSLNEQAEPIS